MPLKFTCPVDGQFYSERVNITFADNTVSGTSTVQVGGQTAGEMNLTMTKTVA